MVHLLTGKVDSGKTALIERVISNLGHLHKRVDGFLTRKVYEGNQFIGYDLFDLKKREACPFIRMTSLSSGEQVGRFYFLPTGQEKAIRIILRHQIIDYLIVDEVGPLELAGRGLWPALRHQLRRSGFRGLLVIRIGLLEPFIALLHGLEIRQFNLTSPSIEAELQAAIESLYPAG